MFRCSSCVSCLLKLPNVVLGVHQFKIEALLSNSFDVDKIRVFGNDLSKISHLLKSLIKCVHAVLVFDYQYLNVEITGWELLLLMILLSTTWGRKLEFQM